MPNRAATYGAIRKLLATLDDPFTRFLEPSQLAALRRGTAGGVWRTADTASAAKETSNRLARRQFSMP